MIESGNCPHCGGSLFRDEDKEVRCQQCGKPPLWKPPPRTEQEIAREKRRRGAHHSEGRAERAAASAELENRIAGSGRSSGHLREPKSEAISPGKSPEPREGIMMKKKKRGTRKSRDNFLESNREAIIQDYHTLTSIEFLAKWHLSSNKWGKLSDLWNVKKKGRGSKKVDETSQVVNKPAPTVDETAPAVDETPFRTAPVNKRTGARALWRF